MRFLFVVLPLLIDSRILHKPREFRCSNLVVFGDSLSDDGVEAMGISHGFTRNSNGPIYAEYLNTILSCEQYTNMAYSGARSGRGNFYFDDWSGVGWQVDKYIEASNSYDQNPLIIFQAGGIMDFLTGENDTTAVVRNIQESINNLTESMQSGTLVVLSLVDVSSAPGVKTADDSDDMRNRLTQMVTDTNRQLWQVIMDGEMGVRKMSPEVHVHYIDINTVVMSTMFNLNTTHPFTYQSPDTHARTAFKYAYHDLWSPSTVVHFGLAKEISRQLQDL